MLVEAYLRAAHLYVRRIMDEIAKLLTLIELNLTKLGRQYKSGQAVLIHEALEALTKVRHLNKPIEPTTKGRGG